MEKRNHHFYLIEVQVFSDCFYFVCLLFSCIFAWIIPTPLWGTDWGIELEWLVVWSEPFSPTLFLSGRILFCLKRDPLSSLLCPPSPPSFVFIRSHMVKVLTPHLLEITYTLEPAEKWTWRLDGCRSKDQLCYY